MSTLPNQDQFSVGPLEPENIYFRLHLCRLNLPLNEISEMNRGNGCLGEKENEEKGIDVEE